MDLIIKDELSIEPRLLEYLSKKRFYKRNNIATAVSLEKEFQITPEDMETLKGYITLKKLQKFAMDTPEKNEFIPNDNGMKFQNFSSDYDETEVPEFLSDKFRDDPRFARLKEK